MKVKNSLLFLLMMVLLLGGCGKKEENSGRADGNGTAAQDNRLYVKYQTLSMDSRILGADSQMLGMDCLATAEAVYVTGVRRAETGEETDIYRILPDKEEPELIAAYPAEKLLTWCAGENSIAFIGLKMDGFLESQEKQYTLHVLQEKSLVETAPGEKISEETYSLNGAFASMTEYGSFSAMAIKGDEVVLSDMLAKAVFVIEPSTGILKQHIAMETEPAYLAYREDDSVLGLVGSGVLYEMKPSSGSREKIEDNIFGQISRGQCCFIGEKEILIGTGNSLYTLAVNSLESRKILDYTDFDIGLQDGSRLFFEEGQGKIVTWNTESSQVEVYYLSDTPFAEKEEKEIVTMEGYMLSDELRAAVVSFNKTSEEYRIELIGEEETDYADFYTVLQTQLLSGGGPDLLMLTDNMHFPDYVEKGYIEDLLPYIQRDLQEEDYVPEALYAYEKAGGVYALESSFVLSLMMGKEETIGDREGWNFEEMAACMEEHPEITAYEEHADVGTVLRDCLAFGGIAFTDYDAIKKCILFAEKYGIGSSSGLPGGEEAVLGENVLLTNEQINSPLMLADLECLYGENLLFIGFPFGDGSGINHAGTGLSINAASSHKEGAWAFLKFLLGREHQFSIRYQFPVLKEAYEQKLEEYLYPQSYDLYLPEAGGIVTVTSPYTMPRSGRQIDNMTVEQVDKVRKLVEKSRVFIWESDYEAWSIINEEAGAYYNGDKTIDEVMEAIRGRMEVYMEEKK
ncbi:MAG: ABC transporter substrate-binding protein [Lachnospiraceae bacterium]